MKKILLVVLALLTVCTADAKKWPKDKFGGNEKLFFSQEDIKNIRYKIDTYDWAKDLYRQFIDELYVPRQSSVYTGGIRQDIVRIMNLALYYRISGDVSVLPEVVDYIVRYYKLHVPERALYKDIDHPGKFLWSHCMYGDVRLLIAYDLIKDHPLMRDYKPAMKKRLDETIHYLEAYFNQAYKHSNTRMWSTATLAMCGFMNEDDAAVDMAINGKWGFKESLRIFRDNGQFRPEPAFYCFSYVDSGFILMAQAARLSGYEEDLFEYTVPENGASLRKMIHSAIQLMQPDGILISRGDHSEEGNISDDRYTVENCRLAGTADQYRIPTKLEFYYSVFQDPEIGWLLSQNPARDGYDCQLFGYLGLTKGAATLDHVKIPDARSIVCPEMGNAFIKSIEGPDYWNSGALTVHLTTGQMLLSHSQDDYFNITLNAFHKNIYNDWFLYWDYLCPRKGRGNMTPISMSIFNHNTVAVDCKNPPARKYKPFDPTAPRAVNFSELQHCNGMQIISAEGQVYDGVHQKRTIGLTEEYALDIFNMKSEKAHTYDYMLHSRGESSYENELDWSDYAQINEEYGFERIDTMSVNRPDNIWLAGAKMASVPESVAVTFMDKYDGKGMITHFMGLDNCRIIDTGTPFFVNVKGGWDNKPDLDMPERNPMIVVRTTASDFTYYAIHQPYKEGMEKLVCKKTGNLIIVSSSTFEDSYDINTQTYKRTLKK